MATCPLCSARAGKRYCPAKNTQICAVCCGTRREIEIDCPSSCVHLKASRSYESEKPITDRELLAQMRKYDETFLERFNHVLNVVNETVVQERLTSTWLVDNDVLEVLKAMRATMNTLSSGIYYETLPEGQVRLSLFRRLKDAFDQLMKPDPSNEHSVLRASEAVEVLEFMTLVAQLNCGDRPRSRRYLDWMAEQFGYPLPHESSGLIIP
jgi:hypothetical protein